MTPSILIRLVATATVAAAFLSAQSAPLPTRATTNAEPPAKASAKADDRVQVRLAEVIAMLEEDDLTEPQRAEAKKKLEEIVARLRKQPQDKAPVATAPLSRGLTTASKESDAPAVIRVVRNQDGKVETVEHKALLEKVHSYSSSKAPSNVEVLETTNGQTVVIAPQDPQPAPPPPPPAPSRARAPKAPKAPKIAKVVEVAPEAAEAPAQVIEVEGVPVGSFEVFEMAKPLEVKVEAPRVVRGKIVEVEEQEPTAMPRRVWGRVLAERAANQDEMKVAAREQAWAKVEQQRVHEELAKAHEEMKVAAREQAMAKVEQERAHEELAKAHEAMREAEGQRVRVVRARDQAGKFRVDLQRAEAEQKAAVEVRNGLGRAVAGRAAAKPVAGDDAELRAMIEEMRAEMRALRELIQELRTKADREEEQQAHAGRRALDAFGAHAAHGGLTTFTSADPFTAPHAVNLFTTTNSAKAHGAAAGLSTSGSDGTAAGAGTSSASSAACCEGASSGTTTCQGASAASCEAKPTSGSSCCEAGSGSASASASSGGAKTLGPAMMR